MSQFADQPDAYQPPPKSNSGLKIFLWVVGILGGLIILSCGGCIIGSIVLFNNAVSEDPAQIKQVAQDITEIDVPDGYDPLFSFNMGFTMVAFGQEGDQSGRVLMLMAFPEGMGDEQQMRQQMDQSLREQGKDHNLRQLNVETRTYTIRGEECSVQIMHAEMDDGSEVRQITAVFTAKDGRPAMLMLMMPEERWADGGEQEMEAMFESMR